MSSGPIAKQQGGAWYPIYKDSGYGPRPWHGGADECGCCGDSGCCVELVGGTDNGDGTYTFDTTAVEFTVTLPNPNSRVVGDGENGEVSWTIKSGYTSGSNQNHYAWATRDWGIIDAGDGTFLQTSQANWRLWENTDNAGNATFAYKACWHGYSDTLEIFVGADVGLPAGENVTISFAELEASDDCCIYNNDCEPCHWTFPAMGDAGPEIVQNLPEYWFTVGEWRMKVVYSGRDPLNQTLGYGDSASARVSLRPEKDHYLDYTTESDVILCMDAEGWVGKGGTRTKVGGSQQLYLQESCGSAVVTDQCTADIIGPTASGDYFDHLFEFSIPECDDPCRDDELYVLSQVSWEVTSPSKALGSGSPTMTECPTSDPCCGSESVSQSASSAASGCACLCVVVHAECYSCSPASEPDDFDPGAGWTVWYEEHVVDDFSTPSGGNYHVHMYALSFCGSSDSDTVQDDLQDYIDSWEADGWTATIQNSPDACPEGETAIDDYLDNWGRPLTTPAAPNETRTVITDESPGTC